MGYFVQRVHMCVAIGLAELLELRWEVILIRGGKSLLYARGACWHHEQALGTVPRYWDLEKIGETDEI